MPKRVNNDLEWDLEEKCERQRHKEWSATAQSIRAPPELPARSRDFGATAGSPVQEEVGVEDPVGVVAIHGIDRRPPVALVSGE